VPAQRTSRPQISWKIDSQADCAELIRLIADCGFHGRRAAEFGIWRTAVNAWRTGAGAARRARLRSLKEQLRVARTFGHGARAARPFSGGHRQTLGYISVLVCAEGCFQLSTLRPRFSMHMRGDERPLLELLRDTTDCGRIYDHTPAGPLNPSSSWIVTSRRDLERLAEMLYRAALPGRKGAELEPWFVGVAEVCTSARLGVRPRRMILEIANDRLLAARRYRPSTRELLRLPGRNRRAESLAALRAWSALVDGRLSCTSYAEWQRAQTSIPTRNTIARLFGSWHAAMQAAGLAERAARRRPTEAGDAEARCDRRQAQRARVLAALRRFEAERGRLPHAMEFFRWRRSACPEAPAQATVYRLFPGGWQTVLQALAVTPTGPGPAALDLNRGAGKGAADVQAQSH